MPRKPIGDVAMTPAERTRKHRQEFREKHWHRQPWDGTMPIYENISWTIGWIKRWLATGDAEAVSSWLAVHLAQRDDGLADLGFQLGRGNVAHECNATEREPAAPDEVERLRAEVAELRARLETLDRTPSQISEPRSYLRRFNIVARKLGSRLDDKERRHRELDKLRNAFLKMDRGLCAMEQAVGLRDQHAKRAKVQALLDRPGNEHEGAAASAAMARLDAAPDDRDGEWSVTRPEPLPATREELLARKKPRRR
jgi:hypothetical protein